MTPNELAQLYTYLKSADNIARTRPEYSRVWDAIETALYELDMALEIAE
jgi:hypothetical protein